MLLVKYHKSGINDSSWRSGGIILLNNKSTFGLLYNYSPMLLSMPFYSQCKVTVVGDYLRQQQCMVQIRKDNMIRAQHHMKQYQDRSKFQYSLIIYLKSISVISTNLNKFMIHQ